MNTEATKTTRANYISSDCLISNIRAYIEMQQLPDDVKKANGIKTNVKIPRYDVTGFAGYYPPFEAMRSKNGKCSMYLQGENAFKNRTADRITAEKHLQATAYKKSINLSGIYLIDDGCNDVYIGYGNPHREKNDTNPFSGYTDDSFVFIISKDWRRIEVVIIENGYYTQQATAQAFADGKYNAALETLRGAAKPIFEYKAAQQQKAVCL